MGLLEYIHIRVYVCAYKGSARAAIRSIIEVDIDSSDEVGRGTEHAKEEESRLREHDWGPEVDLRSCAEICVRGGMLLYDQGSNEGMKIVVFARVANAR